MPPASCGGHICDGQLFKATHGQLVSFRRVRQSDEVQLLRRRSGRNRARNVIGEMRMRLRELGRRTGKQLLRSRWTGASGSRRVRPRAKMVWRRIRRDCRREARERRPRSCDDLLKASEGHRKLNHFARPGRRFQPSALPRSPRAEPSPVQAVTAVAAKTSPMSHGLPSYPSWVKFATDAGTFVPANRTPTSR